MKRQPLIALSLTVLALTGFAQADKRIPGTSVSYKVQKSGGKNTSMIFIDSASDRTGKTYFAVKCQGQGTYSMSLYAKDALATSETDVVLMVKQGSVINKADGYVRVDRQTGRLSVWETEYKDVNEGLLGTLSKSGSPFTVTVMREGGNLQPVVYGFHSKGMRSGMEAVNYCK